MWFTNFFSHPEYIQKPKSRDGYITNVNPMSRRYLTPDSLSIDDTEGADESVSVNSSAIDGYTYNEKTGDLYVQFKGGGKDYLYPNVPKDVVEDFGKAPSKGRFVHDVLKPEYSTNI